MANTMVKRGAQIVVLLAPPLLASLWGAHRAAAMRSELTREATTVAQDYDRRAQEREDRRRGLTVGARFPVAGFTEAHGAVAAVGQGATTVVVFTNACATCRAAESWKQLARHFSGARIITIFVDTPAAVNGVARSVRDARLRFVADPQARLHELYGVQAQRAFIVGRAGIIIDQLGPWSRDSELESILQRPVLGFTTPVSIGK